MSHIEESYAYKTTRYITMMIALTIILATQASTFDNTELITLLMFGAAGAGFEFGLPAAAEKAAKFIFSKKERTDDE